MSNANLAGSVKPEDKGRIISGPFEGKVGIVDVYRRNTPYGLYELVWVKFPDVVRVEGFNPHVLKKIID